jgi:hypothetical protein
LKRSPVISLLTLEEVYGNIAFYLANWVEIDAYLAAEESEFDSMPQPLQATDPALYDDKLDWVKIQPVSQPSLSVGRAFQLDS